MQSASPIVALAKNWRSASWAFDDLQPQLCRIELQRVRNLVELLDFPDQTAWLHRACRDRAWVRMAACCNHPAAVETIVWQVIRHRLEARRCKTCYNAIRTIRTTVEPASSNAAPSASRRFHTAAQLHQHRVTTAMAIKDFFARQTNLHRAARHHRGFADDDFVVKRIGLATKTTALWR